MDTAPVTCTLILFAFRGADRLVTDVIEWVAGLSRKDFVTDTLTFRGFGEANAVPGPGAPQLTVCGSGAKVGPLQIFWGVPRGKRKPRPCVKVEDVVIGADDFISSFPR